MKEKIPIYILNGFLGAGKTTLLKKMLTLFEDKKTAIIINEFGKMDVDGILISDEDVDMIKIENGSIFCSCKSDKFVEALVKVVKLKPDIIIVESSGLSNPSTMPKIFDLVMKITDNQLAVKGVIGVMDASNVEKLITTAVMIKNQIAHSNIIILNKIDLVNEEQLTKAEKAIRKYNKNAPIIRTKYCSIPKELFEYDLTQNKIDYNNLPPIQHMLGIQSILIQMPDNIDKNKLIFWMKTFVKYAYRVKGFVQTKEGWYFAESVDGRLSITPSKEQKNSYLVILSSGTQPIKEKILQHSQKYLGTKIKI